METFKQPELQDLAHSGPVARGPILPSKLTDDSHTILTSFYAAVQNMRTARSEFGSIKQAELNMKVASNLDSLGLQQTNVAQRMSMLLERV